MAIAGRSVCVCERERESRVDARDCATAMREPERERETRACGGSLPSQRGVPASFARNEGEKLKEIKVLNSLLMEKTYSIEYLELQ